MEAAPATDRLQWRDWLALSVFGLVLVLFGWLVVHRSAGSDARRTDLEVYARAAWGARTGHDIYEVTDSHGWHYCYPPTFAVLMGPLGDPPPGESRAGYLPFAVTVAIWYSLSILALFLAAHVLATAIESLSTLRPRVGSRRWLWLRLGPILITLPAIGNTLSRGQINLVVMMLLCSMIAAAIGRHSMRAGSWLGFAVALKAIPAFLGLIALRQRDWRWIGATAVAAIVMAIGLPALVLGPTEAINDNLKFVHVMVKPALQTADNMARADEMFDVVNTDNQSIQAVLHCWRWWGNPDAPHETSGLTRAGHWMIGAILTLTTLMATRGRRLRGNDFVLFCGSLIVVMVLISPMCHLHYFCFAMPLVLGLLHHEWRDQTGIAIGKRLKWLLILHIAGGAFPLIFEDYRKLGVAPLTTLPLWFEAIRALSVDRFIGRKPAPITVPTQRKAA